jgi:hypothetical protein
MESMSLRRILVGLLIWIATCAPLSAQTYLQVTDVVETHRMGATAQTEFSRKIGLGKDSAKKNSFDVTVADILPSGCRLLSPLSSRMDITGLDCQKHPVTIAQKKIGKVTHLRLGFKGIPTLVKNRDCCDCSGECGRACSVEFTYRASMPGKPEGMGRVVCSVVPAYIHRDRYSRIRVSMEADGTPLKDAILLVAIPKKIQGAEVRLGNHSSGLRSSALVARGIGLTSRRGIGKQTFFVELDVKPTGQGTICLADFVKLEGRMPKPVRPVPSLERVSTAAPDQVTYAVTKCDLLIATK